MHGESPRILIVRLSAVGDVIHGLPVLCALRDRLPEAFLGWAVHENMAGVLRLHEALDEVLVVPRSLRRMPAALWRLRRQFRRPPFDVALDLQGLTKSALIAWLLGAKRRIGLGGIEGRELSPWLNSELVTPIGTHVIDRNLELLQPLGIVSPRVHFDFPVLSEDSAWADQVLAELGLLARFAVLNPGAGWPSKRWPHDRFTRVARHLDRGWGLLSLVVWAGEEEGAWATDIVADSQGAARLAPPTTLIQLAALLRRASLFVGSDTGPLHLAAAVGTPCVALFGPTPGDRNGPYGPQHMIVQRVLPGATFGDRKAGGEWMAAITIEDVCRACDALLLRRQQSA